MQAQRPISTDNAGQLDERVTIQSVTTQVQGREANPSWDDATHATAPSSEVWASVRRVPVMDEESSEGFGGVTRRAYRFRIRSGTFTQGITEKWRLSWRGKFLQIRAIDRDSERRGGMIEIVAVSSEDAAVEA